jgi:hypothetical protein
LGSSIAESSSSAGSFSGEGSARSPYVDGNGDHMVFGAGRPQGDAGPFIDAFSRDYGGERYPGVDVADAGSTLRLSNGSSADDDAYYGNIINALRARDAQRQAASASYRAGAAQAASDLYASGAGDVRQTSGLDLPSYDDTFRTQNIDRALGLAARSTGDSSWVDSQGRVHVEISGTSADLQPASISESPGLLSNLGSIGQAYANGRVGLGDALSMANGQIGGIGNVGRDALTGLVNGGIGLAEFGVNLINGGAIPGELGSINFPKFGYTGRTGSLGPDIAVVGPMLLGVRGVKNAAPQVQVPSTRVGAITGETAATVRGKSIHSRLAAERRADGSFDLVNRPLTDKAGIPIQVTRRVDLKTGEPLPGTGYQVARPDAVRYKGDVIIDDKPMGRPIAKDRQEIIRDIRAYEQSRGNLPRTIGIQRYDPVTGRPIVTELYSPFDFLP